MEPALGTWEAIDSLRVVRTFIDRPLEPAALERILNAGRRAGSSKNEQRWAFVVCRDREHLRELSTLGPWAGQVAGPRSERRQLAQVLAIPADHEGPALLVLGAARASTRVEDPLERRGLQRPVDEGPDHAQGVDRLPGAEGRFHGAPPVLQGSGRSGRTG